MVKEKSKETNIEKLKKKKLSELSVADIKAITNCRYRVDLGKENWIARIYNKTSTYFAIVLIYLGFTGIGATFLWGGLMLFSTLFLWPGSYWLNITSLVILQFAHFIDACDGQIARYQGWRNGKPPSFLRGYYLDQFFHFLIRPISFFGIGIGAWMRFGNIYYFYAGIAIVIFLMLDHIIKLREYDTLIWGDQIKYMKSAREYKGSYAGKFYWIHNLFKPTLLFKSLFFWAVIFNLLHLYLLLALVLSVGLLAKTFYLENKRIRNLDKEILSDMKKLRKNKVYKEFWTRY